MATEPPRPRVVETPLPFIQADAPTDVELGVTTSDDGQWDTIPRTAPPAPVPSIGETAVLLALASGFKARYLIIRHGWHRRKRHL